MPVIWEACCDYRWGSGGGSIVVETSMWSPSEAFFIDANILSVLVVIMIFLSEIIDQKSISK